MERKEISPNQGSDRSLASSVIGRGSERFPWKKIAIGMGGMVAGIGIGLLVGLEAGHLLDVTIKSTPFLFQTLGAVGGMMTGGVAGAVCGDYVAERLGFK
ncbi:hypothetical protein HYU95_05060 [Candidatus Daviesbacteria bacterium]|nr:hypothetical protein [Candidatus Daviesbacteria bacterium]